MKLYKFRPLANEDDFNRAKKILEEGCFWCSQFSELNDPMEGVFYATYKAKIQDIYNAKVKYKICSFSTKTAFENPAMWGYYANGFMGIAIEIEINKNDVKKIKYSKDIPSIDGPPDDNKIREILTVKLPRWKHEKEYRFLKEIDYSEHYIGEITAVYFGNPYGNVNNQRMVTTNSENISKYNTFREQLIKVALSKKCCSVKIEGDKVMEECTL